MLYATTVQTASHTPMDLDAVAGSKNGWVCKMSRSKRCKGNLRVRQAKTIYNAYGYLTWSPALSVRFIGKGKFISASQDIFGAFDFIAKRQYRPLHLVQVTTMSTPTAGSPYDRMKKIDDLNLFDEYQVFVVMAWIPRHEFAAWVKNKDAWVRYSQQRFISFLIGSTE